MIVQLIMRSINMDEKISRDTVDFLTYEIIERITRFIEHLKEIELQFYIDQNQAKTQYNLIHNYKESLLSFLKMAILSLRKNTDHESNLKKLFNFQNDILKAINNLHENWLSILPRPREPIELTRFERVIFKQIVKLSSKTEEDEVILSINENLGEEITKNPLAPFIAKTLKPIVDDFNLSNSPPISLDRSMEPSYITIPRVDASNTFRWPSLLHEMSHSLMRNSIFEKKNILEDYYATYGNSENILLFFKKNFEMIREDNQTDILHNWLKECWCDLFASILMGPSLFFSQYLVFLNAPFNDNVSHPPAIFRLLLIKTILAHRFASLYEKINPAYFTKCEELINTLKNDEINWETDDCKLTYIFSSFKNYFINHFFSSENNNFKAGVDEKLNSKLNEIVGKYVSIGPDVIIYLTSQLKKGLPIPSIKTKNSKGEYEEIPTYVQEIFLASWISRFEMLERSIIEKIYSFKNDQPVEDYFKDNIQKLIERHDQAILKSIQVSEWFDFFIKQKDRSNRIIVWDSRLNNSKRVWEKKISSNGTLVDKEIKELIFDNKLQFIPLINIEQQIGTTSIDIRLGTSFQLFYPDQYGIIDFTEDIESNPFHELSRRINLDFIEGVTITPGQFLLGHSMEYLKLPNNVCGNLEGRSSFARLGIEIHMTAGFIDPGFEGVITFEIYNAGASAVKLYPGMRIGQLRLERSGEPSKIYSDRHRVKYKGLLEHNVSRQNRDSEVELIYLYKIEQNTKKSRLKT